MIVSVSFDAVGVVLERVFAHEKTWRITRCT